MKASSWVWIGQNLLKEMPLKWERSLLKIDLYLYLQSIAGNMPLQLSVILSPRPSSVAAKNEDNEGHYLSLCPQGGIDS